MKLPKIRKHTQNMPQNSQAEQTKSYAHKYTHIHIEILAKNDWWKVYLKVTEETEMYFFFIVCRKKMAKL